jgi:hypothetical protein
MPYPSLTVYMVTIDGYGCCTARPVGGCKGCHIQYSCMPIPPVFHTAVDGCLYGYTVDKDNEVVQISCPGTQTQSHCTASWHAAPSHPEPPCLAGMLWLADVNS